MSENDKSEDAFRTIAEVSSILGVEQHALRYWESQFKQVSPVRRRGNRRLYRPSDINLIAGLRKLLHEDNHTLKAAQKFLDKMGTEHVASLGAEFLHGAGSPGNTPEASEQEPTGPAGSRDAADEAVASSEPNDTASPKSKSVASVSTVGGEPGTEAEPVCEELETETPEQETLIEAAAITVGEEPCTETVSPSEPDDTASPESESVASVSTVGGEPGTEAETVCEELETETPEQKHLIEAAAIAVEEDPCTETVSPSEPDDTASPESESVASVSTVGGELGTEAETVCEELETETPEQKHLIEAAEEVLVVNLTVRNRSYSFSSEVVGELSAAEFEHLRQLVGRLETLRHETEADIKRLRSKFGLASTP